MIEKSRHIHALPKGHSLLWYRIEAVLGQGAFGITYLARDTNLNQNVAIKEYLPAGLAARAEESTVKPISDDHESDFNWGLSRFIREGQTLARFKHRNIVAVNAVFEAHNTAYIVMEHVEGIPLNVAVNRKELHTEQQILDTLLGVMDGVEQIHEAGFIHRDIKPENIHIRKDGSAVLLDFGSARQAVGARAQAMTALVTPGYAPYEQYDSTQDVDKQGPWTDIYALGATFYRAVIGKAPPDAMARMHEFLDGKPSFQLAAEAAAGQYSGALLNALDRALEFKPGNRPQSIAEWRAMLLQPESREDAKSAVKPDTQARAAEPQAIAEQSPEETAIFSSTATPIDFDLTELIEPQPAPPIEALDRTDLPKAPDDDKEDVTDFSVSVQTASFDPDRTEIAGAAAHAPPEPPLPAVVAAEPAAHEDPALEPPIEDAPAPRARRLWPIFAGIAVLAVAGVVAWFATREPATRPASETIPPVVISLDELDTEVDEPLPEGEPGAQNAAEILTPGVDETPPELAQPTVQDETQKLIEALGAAQKTASEKAAEIEQKRLQTEIAQQQRAQATEERSREIDALLLAAQADIDKLRLTKPSGDNALEKLRAVLSLDQGNARALAGLSEIAEKYVELADKARSAGNLDKAEQYLDKAAAVAPDLPRLAEAREALADLRLQAQQRADLAAQAEEESKAIPADPCAPRLLEARRSEFPGVLDTAYDNRAFHGVPAPRVKWVSYEQTSLINQRATETWSSRYELMALDGVAARFRKSHAHAFDNGAGTARFEEVANGVHVQVLGGLATPVDELHAERETTTIKDGVTRTARSTRDTRSVTTRFYEIRGELFPLHIGNTLSFKSDLRIENDGAAPKLRAHEGKPDTYQVVGRKSGAEIDERLGCPIWVIEYTFERPSRKDTGKLYFSEELGIIARQVGDSMTTLSNGRTISRHYERTLADFEFGE